MIVRDLEGRTCQEVAEQLGRPVGTVKSWLARGRQLLRGRLARRGRTGFLSISSPRLTSTLPALPRSAIDAAVRIAGAMWNARGGPGHGPRTDGRSPQIHVPYKLKLMAMAILATGLIAVSAVVAYFQPPSLDTDPADSRGPGAAHRTRASSPYAGLDDHSSLLHRRPYPA